MKDGVLLSHKHGLNPSVGQCFLCLKDFEVILFGRLKHDQPAPGKICMGPQHTCPECEGHMKQGVVLISVDEAKTTDMQNPWRTGGWVVVRDEMITRIVTPPELADQILKARFAFIPDEVWDMLGLPRGSTDDLPSK